MIGEALATANRPAQSCRADKVTLSLFEQLQAISRSTQWDLDRNIDPLIKSRAETCPKAGGC